MNTKEKIILIVVIIAVIYVAANINSINNFLSMEFDKSKENEDTRIIIPESWNTTEEMNMSNQSKSNLSFTNSYVIVDVWDHWPEDNITSISENKFKSMEEGGYVILNKTTLKLDGEEISKEIFTNPSKDTNTSWQHIGVNYVFSKEDVNYAMQVHYFSWIDYHNESYMKEVDDRAEDLIANMHNKHYDGFFSGINHIYEFVKDLTS